MQKPTSKFSVNESFISIFYDIIWQIEAVATKDEIEHLVELCRAEADSMGRITAAILKLLKLDKSLGQATLDQLSSIGIIFNIFVQIWPTNQTPDIIINLHR